MNAKAPVTIAGNSRLIIKCKVEWRDMRCLRIEAVVGGPFKQDGQRQAQFPENARDTGGTGRVA